MILVVVDDIIGVVLWRIMFGSFVGLFEGRGNYGFLTFSTVIVAFAMSSILANLYMEGPSPCQGTQLPRRRSHAGRWQHLQSRSRTDSDRD